MDHQGMLDRLPAIVWQGDPESDRFTYVSRGAEALLGYPLERWLQAEFWSAHLHPDDAAWVVPLRAQKITAGLEHSCEYRMIAADGRALWLRDAVSVELDGGRPVRLQGVMVEVSDRQAVPVPEPLEGGLGERAVLEAVFQHAPIGLGLFDRELRVLQINERLASINGVPASESRGRRPREFVPVVAERVEPILRSVFESGVAVEGLEVSGETPAMPGLRHWISSFLPIRAPHSDRVEAVAAVVQEVTAQRETEDALRASEARYRYLYLRTPAMMHSIDHEGRLVDVSDAWLERMGYAREEVVGRRSTDFLTPESREYAATEVLPEFFRTGVCKDIAYRMVRKDGVVLDILLSAIAERDAEGRFERSLAVLVDVTERKRAEEALRRSEAQLRQAQKMEAIGRLAGGIAHDFNNLLVVILGNAELLMLNECTDQAMRTSAEQIAAAGERAAALTRQILTFSRQQVVQPKILDLNELIRDTESMLRRLLREDIEVVTDLQPSLGRVRIDPGQATQVLMNLAVNASDAMPQGGRLVIETANVTVENDGACEPGEYVLFTVTDTGVGMDAETQARLFEPFFTTKEPGRGTGLGLATVHGIVRQNGGCITVYSEPGRGSSFRVHLPRVEPGASDEPEPHLVVTPLARHATVLVAEDDDMVRKIIADVLHENGYRALCAADADEALRKLDAHSGPVDILLIDIVMPGTGSADLVEQVRARNPHARVIYMSGYAPLGPDGVRVEPRDFLPKPFTMNGLLRKLQSGL